jgi:hypothetical protein
MQCALFDPQTAGGLSISLKRKSPRNHRRSTRRSIIGRVEEYKDFHRSELSSLVKRKKLVLLIGETVGGADLYRHPGSDISGPRKPPQWQRPSEIHGGVSPRGKQLRPPGGEVSTIKEDLKDDFGDGEAMCGCSLTLKIKAGGNSIGRSQGGRTASHWLRMATNRSARGPEIDAPPPAVETAPPVDAVKKQERLALIPQKSPHK